MLYPCWAVFSHLSMFDVYEGKTRNSGKIFGSFAIKKESDQTTTKGVLKIFGKSKAKQKTNKQTNRKRKKQTNRQK